MSEDSDPKRAAFGGAFQANRWVKGCPSPNPKGRPPKKQIFNHFQALNPVAAMLCDMAEQIIELKPGSSFSGMTNLQAAYKMMLLLGMKGNVKALAMWIAAAEAGLVEKQNHHNNMLLQAVEYQDRYLDLVISREKAGKPSPDIPFDPRDIIIDDDGSVTVFGSFSAHSRSEQDQNVKDRDAILRVIELTLNDVADRGKMSVEDRKLLRQSRRALKVLNSHLPPRLRRYEAQ